jgi:hypothetical protein
MTVDEFQKIAPDLIAILAVTIAPIIIARRAAADNISAKRQNWIDDLRKDAASFLQTVRHLEGLRRPNPALPLEDQKKTFEEKMLAEAKAIELSHRIKLRLNPLEADHNHLLALIAGLVSICRDPPSGETEAMREAFVQAFTKQEQCIIGHLQTILKKEWERIKRGEIFTELGRAHYRTGLARFWIAASMLWLVLVAWDIDLLCLIGISFSAHPWCAYPPARPAEVAVQTITLLFGPPLILGAVLLGGVWIATGFWPPPKQVKSPGLSGHPREESGPQ